MLYVDTYLWGEGKTDCAAKSIFRSNSNHTVRFSRRSLRDPVPKSLDNHPSALAILFRRTQIRLTLGERTPP